MKMQIKYDVVLVDFIWYLFNKVHFSLIEFFKRERSHY